MLKPHWTQLRRPPTAEYPRQKVVSGLSRRSGGGGGAEVGALSTFTVVTRGWTWAIMVCLGLALLFNPLWLPWACGWPCATCWPALPVPEPTPPLSVAALPLSMAALPLFVAAPPLSMAAPPLSAVAARNRQFPTQWERDSLVSPFQVKGLCTDHCFVDKQPINVRG